ncbi:MAG: AbrB/MazE/SpoVT family DNA-binding domain-containing protein [Thermomicrobiales bacterium]
MPTVSNERHTPHTYRAKVTGRHAVTLPAELCRRLNISTGDTVEFEVIGVQALLRPATCEPNPPLEGLLSDYFADWEDINRFIEEERGGWEEREAFLDQIASRTPEPANS